MSRKFLNGIDANGKNISNVADGVSASDAVTLQQLQNYVVDIDWKVNVRTATNANIAVASAVVNGASIGGVTVATGDRVLLMGQTAGAENGIYNVVASGAASRSSDANTAEKIKGTIVRVAEGTFADQAWQLITDTITLGTTSLVFTQFGGGGTAYTADGNGLELSGSQFALELDGTTLSKSASGLRIGSGAAGNGLTETNGVLAVGAGTGISVGADVVTIDTSVVVRKFAANCVVTTNPQTFTHNLNTLDVIVEVVDVASGNTVEADVTRSSVNAISVNFGGAPTAAQYRVVVQG